MSQRQEPLQCAKEASGLLSAVLDGSNTVPRSYPADQTSLDGEWASAAFDALPAPVYATDAEGTIVYFNQAAADLAGRRPTIGKDKWCVTWRLFTTDGEPLAHDACPMAIALKEQRAIRGVEAVAERPDGSRVHFMPYPTPMFNAAGKMIGAVNMLISVDQRNAARREVGKREEAEAALTRRVAEQEALFQLTDSLHRAETATEMYEAALDAMHAALRSDRGSILLLDAANIMRFAAWRDLSESYRSAVEGHSPWSADVRNPKPICIDDVANSDLPDALKKTVRDEGIGALSFVPLVADGKLIGKFMTYCNRPHVHSVGERELSLTIARQLSFSIAKLRAEQGRREAQARLRRESEVLQTIVDRSPIMVTMTSADGEVMRLNREFERLSGWSLQDADGGSLMEKCFPDAAYREQVAALVASGQDGWMDVRMRARDGSNIETAWANVRLSDGTQVGLGIDISERKRDERVRQQLAAIVESSDDAIVGKNLDGVIVSWNKSAERLFGYSSDEAIGAPVLMLIPEDRRDEEPAILKRIRKGERVDHFETIRRRKDGNLIDISLTISPIKDGSGRVVGASKIARDIGERKRSELQRDLLIAELSHRVKNTLATVISIARQSFTNPDPVEARRSFDARIRGLARTHSRLAEANWSGVSLDTIVADEIAPYRRDDGKNLRLSGPATVLNPKAALTLGMAIHELATNAAKHGALSVKDGIVDVSWRIEAKDGSLNIQWRESGGPAVKVPTRSGFGRLLLERALASDLRGDVQMTFAPDGVDVVIAIPHSEYSGYAS